MVDDLILGNLILNKEYGPKVIAFLTPDYFQDLGSKRVFNLISEYVTKYNTFPTKEALSIDLTNAPGLNELEFTSARSKIEKLSINEDTDLEWLVDKTEEFCKEQAITNALRQAIMIVDGKEKVLDKGAIPQLLSEALAVSFNTDVGHDFVEDWELRYEKYHDHLERIPFDIELLNRISRGGLPKKTLTVFMGATGVGKTIVLCHLASANLALGKNVLYITLEMGEVGEPSISQRIDANLLDTSIEDLIILPFDTYKRRVARMKEKITGKMIIKEYPTGSASVNHFKFLLNELKLKKGFVPDVIYIDYINICASARMKRSDKTGSYEYIKSISEELRALATETTSPVITATQFNRKGSESSSPNKEDVAESYGLTHTADMLLAITQSADLKPLNQFQIIQLKNRYRDENLDRSFFVGVDKSKMRLYDAEESAQPNSQQPVIKTKPGFNYDVMKGVNAFKDFK